MGKGGPLPPFVEWTVVSLARVRQSGRSSKASDEERERARAARSGDGAGHSRRERGGGGSGEKRGERSNLFFLTNENPELARSLLFFPFPSLRASLFDGGAKGTRPI